MCVQQQPREPDISLNNISLTSTDTQTTHRVT